MFIYVELLNSFKILNNFFFCCDFDMSYFFKNLCIEKFWFLDSNCNYRRVIEWWKCWWIL